MLNTTVNHLSKNLPRLLASKDFSPIMMPTTKFRQLHLPSKNTSIENHNPFLLYISQLLPKYYFYCNMLYFTLFFITYMQEMGTYHENRRKRGNNAVASTTATNCIERIGW